MNLDRKLIYILYDKSMTRSMEKTAISRTILKGPIKSWIQMKFFIRVSINLFVANVKPCRKTEFFRNKQKGASCCKIIVNHEQTKTYAKLIPMHFFTNDFTLD